MERRCGTVHAFWRGLVLLKSVMAKNRIDRLLRELIADLNKAGCSTDSSCQGKTCLEDYKSVFVKRRISPLTLLYKESSYYR
jgi:hypothetical protein